MTYYQVRTVTFREGNVPSFNEPCFLWFLVWPSKTGISSARCLCFTIFLEVVPWAQYHLQNKWRCWGSLLQGRRISQHPPQKISHLLIRFVKNPSLNKAFQKVLGWTMQTRKSIEFLRIQLQAISRAPNKILMIPFWSFNFGMQNGHA